MARVIEIIPRGKHGPIYGSHSISLNIAAADLAAQGAKTSAGMVLTWGRLNTEMSSYQYRDSHVKDKTVSPTVLSLTWESPYL